MNLTDQSVPLVYKAISDELADYESSELVGLSCIARGADTIFAQAILDRGSQLEVVLPSTNYRETKVKPNHAAKFDELLRRATAVHIMPFAVADRTAYEAANERLLTTCDELFAVWDGQGTVDKGGTASVVQYAQERGVPFRVIWPDGVSRG